MQEIPVSGRKIHIAISEMKISGQGAHTLVARDIGTGLSIAVHDALAGIGGIYHLMLPQSEIYPEMAQKKPLVFADTGLPLFLQDLYQQGGDKKQLKVHVAGGADLVSSGRSMFSIGQQNYLKTSEILQKNQLQIHARQVGGNKIRALFLNVGTGQTWVESN